MPYTWRGTGNTITGMLDLTDNSVSEANITNTQHDMFCPGTRDAGYHARDTMRCLQLWSSLSRYRSKCSLQY